MNNPLVITMPMIPKVAWSDPGWLNLNSGSLSRRKTCVFWKKNILRSLKWRIFERLIKTSLLINVTEMFPLRKMSWIWISRNSKEEYFFVSVSLFLKLCLKKKDWEWMIVVETKMWERPRNGFPDDPTLARMTQFLFLKVILVWTFYTSGSCGRFSPLRHYWPPASRVSSSSGMKNSTMSASTSTGLVLPFNADNFNKVSMFKSIFLPFDL